METETLGNTQGIVKAEVMLDAFGITLAEMESEKFSRHTV